MDEQDKLEIQPSPGNLSGSSPQGERERKVDWEDRYKRLYAELENTKKQLERRYATQADQKEDRLLHDLLPTLDNIERVLAQKTPEESCIQLYQGIELTLREFLGVLKGHDLETVQALAEPFDPELHEAVGQVESDRVPAGHVVEVLQTGYHRKGRLVRSARVVVASEE